MQVQKIVKKYRINRYKLVRYQILVEYVFVRELDLIPTDIDLLTLLGLQGEVELSKFCVMCVKRLHKDVAAEQFHIKSQNIRNRIEKLTKRELIEKVDKKKRMIRLKGFDVLRTGDILLNYNFLSLESDKT